MITGYSNLSVSSATPQYGFNKGFQIFEEDGYKATVSELQDNLIEQGCVNMFEKHNVTSDIQKNSLA